MSIQVAFVLPTTSCTVRCEHCFYETGHTPRVEARRLLEPLDEFLDHLVGDGLQQIILTGGEPLLAPALLPLVEACSAKLVHLLLLTRGELLDEERLGALERAGLDDLTLGVQADSPALRALVNRILFQSRFTPTLLTCLTRENLGEVPALTELALRLNLPQLFTPAYVPRDAAAEGRLSLRGLDEVGWQQLELALAPWAERFGAATYLELVRGVYAGRRVHPGGCPMGTSALVIDADGSVYPCFHRHDLRAGNLLAEDWPLIRERLQAAAEELAAAPCFGEHCLSLFASVRSPNLVSAAAARG